MNLTDLKPQKYAFFPIYVEEDQINIQQCEVARFGKQGLGKAEVLSGTEYKEARDMDLKKFTDLITQFGNDVKKIYALSYSAMRENDNCEVLSVALEIIRSIPLKFNITRGSFFNQVFGYFHPSDYTKLVFLINAGEAVNQVYYNLEKNITPLEKLIWCISSSSESSSEPIIDIPGYSSYFIYYSLLGILISAGGVVYNEITDKQQGWVNRIMQPIVYRINVLFLLFEETYLRNELPIELKSIIYLLTIDGLKLAPEVIHKILRIK